MVLLSTWRTACGWGLRGKNASDSIIRLIQNETAYSGSQWPTALFQRAVGVIWWSGGTAALAGPAMEQDPVSPVPAPVSYLFCLFLFSVVYTLLSRVSGCPETGSLSERLSLFRSTHPSRYRANGELWVPLFQCGSPTDKILLKMQTKTYLPF